MDFHFILTAVLCAAVGASLSLLGGGGSVLLVPLLVYIGGVPAKESIALSLLIVGLTSALGSIPYFKKGFVNVRLVFLFVVPGVFFSFFGARLGEHVSAERLLFAFGILMAVIAFLMYQKSTESAQVSEKVVCRPHPVLSAATGGGIGFLTGLLGVGGGFLIVPAITLLMRCSLYTAIGTSLAIIAVNSFTGFAGHLSQMNHDAGLGAVLLASTLLGAVAGSLIGERIKASALQKGFAVLIGAVGIVMAVQHAFKIG